MTLVTTSVAHADDFHLLPSPETKAVSSQATPELVLSENTPTKFVPHNSAHWRESQINRMREFCDAALVKREMHGALGRHNSLEKILQRDVRWTTLKKQSRPPFRFTNKEANVFALNFIKRDQGLAELIVTDGMGATLFAEPNPSDYWQGDEEKFIRPVVTKKPHISELDLDESTQEYSIQLSIPQYEEEQFLGVCVFTLSIPLDVLLHWNVTHKEG